MRKLNLRAIKVTAGQRYILVQTEDKDGKKGIIVFKE